MLSGLEFSSVACGTIVKDASGLTANFSIRANASARRNAGE
jgi:hypothetical protein